MIVNVGYLIFTYTVTSWEIQTKWSTCCILRGNTKDSILFLCEKILKSPGTYWTTLVYAKYHGILQWL